MGVYLMVINLTNEETKLILNSLEQNRKSKIELHSICSQISTNGFITKYVNEAIQDIDNLVMKIEKTSEDQK